MAALVLIAVVINSRSKGSWRLMSTTSLNVMITMYFNDTDDVATEFIRGFSELRKYNLWTTQVTDLSLEILSKMDSSRIFCSRSAIRSPMMV